MLVFKPRIKENSILKRFSCGQPFFKDMNELNAALHNIVCVKVDLHIILCIQVVATALAVLAALLTITYWCCKVMVVTTTCALVVSASRKCMRLCSTHPVHDFTSR